MATYLYGSTYNKKGTTGSYRVFLAYEEGSGNDFYQLILYAGIQRSNSADAGSTGFTLKVSTNVSTEEGFSNVTLSGQTYYTSQADSSNRKKLNIDTSSNQNYLVLNWNKTHNPISITITASLSASNMTTSSVSYSFTISAKTSYQITYDANGGNFPSDFINPQTKWHGENLTLNSSSPTKTYYTFYRWAATSGTVSYYNAGSTYTYNKAATLKAQWNPASTSIAYYYDYNSGPQIDNITMVSQGSYITLRAAPTKEHYTFLGWNTKSDGTGVLYSPGQSFFTGTSGARFYGQWESNYIKPIINSISAYRVENAGDTIVSDTGERIYVNISYTNGILDNQSVSTKCKIVIDNDTSHPVIDSVISSNPFSNDYGTYSKDSSHTVTITLYDDYDSTGISTTINIPTATFAIDLIGSGNNIYMGIMSPAISGQGITVGQDMYFKIGSTYRSLLTQLIPIGKIDMYAGSTAPAGWLLCDGSAISRTTYASLFAVIGTTYGTGDGSTTFNVPNLQGKFPIGANTTYTLGGTGGSTTLTTDNLPAHTHGSKSLIGTFKSRKWTTGALLSGATGIVTIENSSSTGNSAANYGSAVAQHEVTIDATHEHDAVGKANPDAFLPPYVGVNYIIYTGK